MASLQDDPGNGWAEQRERHLKEWQKYGENTGRDQPDHQTGC